MKRPIPPRLQLLTRSCSRQSNDSINDFDIIIKKMNEKKEFSCEVIDRTNLTIAFSVLFENEKYLVVFCVFPASGLHKEEIDVTITNQLDVTY